MARPKIARYRLVVEFYSKYPNAGEHDSLDMQVLKVLSRVEKEQGVGAVEELLKGLIREAFKGGWPDTALKANLSFTPILGANSLDSSNQTKEEDTKEEENLAEEEINFDVPPHLRISG